MKCYYEVLEIARDADDAQIKSSYRKLALKWHPDKNINNEAEAKEQFQLVQQAYEVLSDSQERAWYDNHRDEILKGKNTDYEEEALDVFQYFTASCYKGYDKNESKNFYAVYSDVFSQIFSEDFEYMTEEEIEEVPVFGDADSDYETIVRPFYVFAESYSTKKSYAWLFPHDVTEKIHRKINKLMDKENKKIQLKARKERNEEVRNLVNFVKKRDRRVAAYKKLLEEKAEENRVKSEKIRLEQMRRKEEELREQELKHANGVLNKGYEEQLEQLESAYAKLYTQDSEEEAGDESENDDVLYCEACNRLFKDENSYKNHLSTKKHKANVMLLEIQQSKNQMEEEETENPENLEQEKSNADEENEKSSPEPKKRGKNKKQKGKKPISRVSESSETEIPEPTLESKPDDDDFAWDEGNKKSKKGKGKGKNTKNVSKQEPTASSSASTEEKVPQKSQPATSSTSEDLKCATCNNSFPSKNKLFNHLKQSGHSVYLPKKK